MAAILLAGCCPQRLLDTSTSDSTRIVVNERIVKIADTVFIDVPREVERIVTCDTISELGNSWAVSRALVSGGYLHHSLETIAQSRPVPVQGAAVVRDSIVVRKVEVERVVEVPRTLTRWQTFRLNGFWVLLAVVIVFVGVKLVPIVGKIISG